MLAADILQAGVYAALQADEALPLRVSGIYDQPPSGSKYPYIAMGDATASTNNVKGRRGTSITFDIHIWSAENSQMQVKELMHHIDEVLHDVPMDLGNFELVSLRFVSSGVIRQFNQEGMLFRGRLTYQALIFGQS